MNNIEKIVADFNSAKFVEWKKHLTIEEQAVFILHYFKGYSIIQIAEIMNYSDSTIKRLLRKARNKIQKLFP